MRALVFIVLGALLGSCSRPPSLLEVIQHIGELRVITEDGPATFFYGADAPRGIEYELAKGFADRLGVDLRIMVAKRPDNLLSQVMQHGVHLAAASVVVTEPQTDKISYGPAYQRLHQQVIYRRGTHRPRGLEDLVGGRIDVRARSAQAALLDDALAEHSGLLWREDPRASYEELVRRVDEGLIDYTIVPSNAFALLRHTYPEARAAFSVGDEFQVSWVLPKGAARLEERVAAYFAEIEATGELDTILERYYFATREFDYVGSRAFRRHVETRLPLFVDYFREAEHRTGVDWRLLAAIGYQESHWNPDAVSPTGVRGLMMLTRDTASMMDVENRRDARESVLGGADYFVAVRSKLPERIAEPDRTWLAVAAYNLGFGHLEDARIITEIQGGNPDRWDHVRERLPLLTDEAWYSRVRRGFARGHIAATYVDNVRHYYDLLMWLVDRETVTEYRAPAAEEPSSG